MSVEDSVTARCPVCRKKILADAVICPVCGQLLPDQWAKKPPAVGGKIIASVLWLLALIVIVSFLIWRNNESSTDAHPLDKSAAVFLGQPTRPEVENLMNRVLINFGEKPTEDHYNRLANVLVRMRTESGVPEMSLLRCMLGLGNVLGKQYVDGAGLCAAYHKVR